MLIISTKMLNVWARILDDYLTQPYGKSLCGIQYGDFNKNTITPLLEDVLHNVCEGTWFQHDATPSTLFTPSA
jgi:hypothetical protein